MSEFESEMSDLDADALQLRLTKDGEPLPEGTYILMAKSDGKTVSMAYISAYDFGKGLARSLGYRMGEEDDG